MGTAAPPPPPPLPPPPSPAPPRLQSPLDPSALQVSLPNFVGTGGRSVTCAAAAFVDKDRPALEELQRLGLTKAMRALDRLRKHIVTTAEGDTLGANGRLDAQDRSGLLTLCGCQRGCRLTSDEMKTIQRLTHGMSQVFASLELKFETLSLKLRDNNYEEQSRHQGELKAFFEAADSWLAFYDQARAVVAKKQAELRLELISPENFQGAIESQGRQERLPEFPTWLSTLMERYRTEQERRSVGDASPTPGGYRPRCKASGASRVHRPASSCHGYEATCHASSEGSDKREPNVQQSAVDARSTTAIDSAATRMDAANLLNSTAAAEDAAPRAHLGAAPILRQGLRTAEGDTREEVAADDFAPEPAATSFAVDSLAKFSRFLALLVASAQEEHTESITESERAALVELLRASDDGSARGELGFDVLDDNRKNEQQSSSAAPAASGPELSHVGSPGSPRPLRYWARRIHRFLLSVRELRATPERDPASLEATMKVTRRGGGSGRRGQSPLFPPPRRELPGL